MTSLEQLLEALADLDRTREAMTAGGWQAQATSLIRKLDPHYGDATIYFCDMRAVGLSTDRVQGATSPILDLRLRDHLKRDGLWRGRGFCAVIAASEILDSYHRLLTDWHAVRRIIGVALHEFCHYSECPPLSSESQAETLLAACPPLAECISSAAEPGIDRVTGQAHPAWHQHDFRFARAAIHVTHRATVLAPEWKLAIDDVWRNRFGLSSQAAYVEALGDEPEQRSGESLAAVMQSPMPPIFGFFGLWDINRAQRASVTGSTE